MTSVTNGGMDIAGNTCSVNGQDKIDRAIIDSFNGQPLEQPYNLATRNSNTFIHSILRDAGLAVIPNVPFGAYGW